MSQILTSYRIIGIDPGSQITGFGILEIPSGIVNIKKIRLIAAGVLKSQTKLPHYDRSGYLHDAMFQLTEKYQPEWCAIEKAFAGVNINSALRLGETRGALIAAVRRHKIQVAELTPTHVKKTVTGQGHASKDQVAAALKYLIGFDRGDLPHDASDAIAIALSHALSLGAYTALPKPVGMPATLSPTASAG
ncbi:MAG: crossover junction endodeoxyribonuclease RuvC [Chitinophagaceae bacterium]|nr:crossover junction endodeoxyribonuclease RuvC [Oligoflexus sp.]